jgi:heme A synthase
MELETKLGRFAKYAWLVLGWNIIVILWGVFLRASKSGDGCGQHWLTCHGEVVPSAPQLKTVIEFSHRVTRAFDGILVIIMVIWAIVIWRSDRSAASGRVMKMAAASLVLVIVEGLLGAGLVLTGNTAETLTPERPFWMAAHLVNTLILLALVTLTAWFAENRKALNFKVNAGHIAAIAAAAAAIFFVGISGSIAALSSMLFPAGSITEGMAQDFSATSHMLLRLRLLHPISAILTGVLLIFISDWLRKLKGTPGVTRWSNVLSILILVQIAFGAATLLMLAPIVMQLGHLLLADSIWISFVLLTANFLAEGSSAESPPAAAVDQAI